MKSVICGQTNALTLLKGWHPQRDASTLCILVFCFLFFAKYLPICVGKGWFVPELVVP